MKHIIRGLIMFALARFAFWVGGVGILLRGEQAGLALTLSLFVGIGALWFSVGAEI